MYTVRWQIFDSAEAGEPEEMRSGKKRPNAENHRLKSVGCCAEHNRLGCKVSLVPIL